jgi:hypothetical protein
MRLRARTIATASGVLAVASLLFAGLSFREDLLWWWRMRGVVKVKVSDFLLGDFELGSMEVTRAAEATRQFISSLPRKPPSVVEIVGYESQVRFLGADDGDAARGDVRLEYLYPRNSRRCIISDGGVRFQGTSSGWFLYLRGLLKPLVPGLVQAWHSKSGDPSKRLKEAQVLILLAPDTAGVLETIAESFEKKNHDCIALIWFLNLIGPRERALAPSLRRLIDDDPGPDLRAMAEELLGRIEGK